MDILDKYGLHDTKINNIIVNDNGLILVFNEGIYQLNNDKEYTLTKHCLLKIEIMHFSPQNLYEHIEILTFSKNRFSEIDLTYLIKLLRKYYFDIDDVLYSPFSKSMLIKGFVGKSKIEFIVSEIGNIDLQFSIE